MEVLRCRELTPVLDLLPRHLGVLYTKALDRGTCATYVRGVYEARDAWTPNFGALQFTLGRAWYTHLEMGLEQLYFRRAQESDANVRRFLPGLQEWMMATIATLVGAPVVQRSGWCGPGVHIFPAGNYVAIHGGEVHYDTEGMSDEQLAGRARALTLVFMLQPPETGGELRLWDMLFDGEDDEPEPTAEPTVVEYGVGDLLVIDSYRLHQIGSFTGTRDRISMTAHLVRGTSENTDRWEVWF